MNILVLDVGTSSMRGILFDESGNQLLKHQVKYLPVYGKDGEVSQPSDDFKNAMIEIVKNIVSKGVEQGIRVENIAITSQRSSIIPIDSDGIPLMDTIMWQDIRNRNICDELNAYNEMLFDRTGSKVNTVFSGSKMTWVRRNCPEIYEKVHKFVNIPEYLIYLMTGEFHSDVTYASRSGLMNLRERKWDSEILKFYEVEEAHLCPLHEPGEICGVVSPEFAAQTGLRTGTPVISSGGDQQCAAIGQGAYREGSLSIVAGTGGFLVTASDGVPENLKKDVICNCSSVKGRYMIEANVLTCCSAFDWFCRNFYGDGNAENVDYRKINQDLEMISDLSSALVLPYFKGRSTPDWNAQAKAVFSEITLSTDRRDLLKGLVEGICLEINNNLNSFRNYVSLETASISGGLTNSDVINQLQADIYGISLKHKSDSESTALGALMVALCGLKVYESFDVAYEKIRGRERVTVYSPDPVKHEKYKEKQEKMKALYEKLYTAG